MLCLRCAFYLLSIYPHGLSCLCYVVSFFWKGSGGVGGGLAHCSLVAAISTHLLHMSSDSVLGYSICHIMCRLISCLFCSCMRKTAWPTNFDYLLCLSLFVCCFVFSCRSVWNQPASQFQENIRVAHDSIHLRPNAEGIWKEVWTFLCGTVWCALSAPFRKKKWVKKKKFKKTSGSK